MVQNIDTKRKKKKHPVRKWILLALAALVVGFTGYKLVSGWIDTWPKFAYSYGTAAAPVKYPECKFAVVSDLHVYDPSLGTSGEAFQAYLDSDRKLLAESSGILDFTVDKILQSGVQFVLVPGDITKDGEKADHELAAKALSKLTAQGIKVFVVPGNHDVNNPASFSYSDAEKTPVANITAEEFAQIYQGFGYGDALMRDSGSLSYVAEPVPGLWLVALDACRYRDNKPGEEPVTAGRFTQAEESWLEGVLKQANGSGKAVIVMMHHGVVEHWDGQSKLHPEYLVEDYPHIGEMMASWGVRLAFTGHYHSNDVAESVFPGKGFLVDVETGSLVTSPCPYRICSIDAAGRLNYSTEKLSGIFRPGTDFEQYSAEYLRSSVETQAFDTLSGYMVAEADARTIAKAVSEAFAAHYAGDEDPVKAVQIDESRLQLWSRVVLATQRYVLDGLWHDPSVPADGNGSIDLVSRN